MVMVVAYPNKVFINYLVIFPKNSTTYYSGRMNAAIQDLLRKALAEQDFVLSHITHVRSAGRARYRMALEAEINFGAVLLELN
jgi:hypothetical protein